MNQFTETPQAASTLEILRPAPQIELTVAPEPAAVATARQLGRILSRESHLSFLARDQPQMMPPIASGTATNTAECKRITTPHRPKNRRQTRVQPENRLPR